VNTSVIGGFGEGDASRGIEGLFDRIAGLINSLVRKKLVIRGAELLIRAQGEEFSRDLAVLIDSDTGLVLIVIIGVGRRGGDTVSGLDDLSDPALRVYGLSDSGGLTE